MNFAYYIMVSFYVFNDRKNPYSHFYFIFKTKFSRNFFFFNSSKTLPQNIKELIINSRYSYTTFKHYADKKIIIIFRRAG